MDHSLALPLLSQIGLTLAVMFWLAYTRFSVLLRKGGYAQVRANGFPKLAVNASDNFKNQFELPVLFLTLCLFHIAVGLVSPVVTTAAWAFVVFRILHAGVQLGPNVIFPWRFGAFILSALCVTTIFIITLIEVL